MPLHITLSRLAFTSHCIFFWYIRICPVSSAYTIGVASFAWPRCISYLLSTGHWSGYLFPGYLFPALFANHSLYFYVSSPCVTCFFSFAFTVCWLTLKGRCSGFIVSDTVCYLDIDLVSSTCTLGLSCSIILVQWLLLWTSNRYKFIFHLGTIYLHHFRQRLPYFVCFRFE